MGKRNERKDKVGVEKDPKRLIDKDGNFHSKYPGGKGSKTICIGYLNDILEHLYHNTTHSTKKKLKYTLIFEKEIDDILNRGDNGNPIMGIPCTFVPFWSVKLMEDLKKRKKVKEEIPWLSLEHSKQVQDYIDNIGDTETNEKKISGAFAVPKIFLESGPASTFSDRSEQRFTNFITRLRRSWGI